MGSFSVLDRDGMPHVDQSTALVARERDQTDGAGQIAAVAAHQNGWKSRWYVPCLEAGVRASPGVFVVPAVLSCAVTQQPFRAHDDANWVAFTTAVPNRTPTDVVGGLRRCARVYGCSIDRNCEPGFRGPCYGVTAYCDAKVLSVIALPNEQYAVGCTRPTTVAECDALLTKIVDECD
jgi:hypothetical protein